MSALASARTALEQSGKNADALDLHLVSGGCIHQSFRVEANGGRFFLKLNQPEVADAFTAEADGLQALRAAGARAPEPLGHGHTGDHAFLLLEYLDLGDPNNAMRALGAALATMHSHAGEAYGWHRNNYIGTTAQINTPQREWIGFWGECRLRPQSELAGRNGYEHIASLCEKLIDALPTLLAGHEPVPSLLHGDLWSGNAGTLDDGTPVLFDPAAYYGDAETDLAMTELFGGFSADFYAGYRSARPIHTGYERRKPLYQLYHLLNHLNLFGAGYMRQCESTMLALLEASKNMKP
jgi:protein-ribulosamine 3-kinase